MNLQGHLPWEFLRGIFMAFQKGILLMFLKGGNELRGSRGESHQWSLRLRFPAGIIMAFLKGKGRLKATVTFPKCTGVAPLEGVRGGQENCLPPRCGLRFKCGTRGRQGEWWTGWGSTRPESGLLATEAKPWARRLQCWRVSSGRRWMDSWRG